jgi:IclR family transcriptional regulator, KDG regulon repressor
MLSASKSATTCELWSGDVAPRGSRFADGLDSPSTRSVDFVSNRETVTVSQPSPRYWVPIVGHAIRTIEIFDDGSTHLSLQEVSQRSGVSKSSTFRILRTLEGLGYVARDPDTRLYRLGLRVLEIANRVRSAHNVVTVARPHMRQLQHRYLETVNLAAWQGKDVYYVEILESQQPFRMTAVAGSRAPLHATAVGKAIASSLPAKGLAAMLAGERLQRFTDNTITSRAELAEVLAVVRRQGYALDDEEAEPGASCVAVPIFSGEEHATHALSVSGPTHRIRTQRRSIIRDLRQAAAAIRSALASA